MVWQVREDGRGNMLWGDVRRRKLTRNGCNEPFKNRYWCPKRGWFMTSPCPFGSRIECQNFKRMCGAL